MRRVEMTDEASGTRTTARTGVVVGFGREPNNADCVRIVRDGLKTPESWHMKFWRVSAAQ